MRAGQLDRVVTIRRKTISRDGFNSSVAAWADLVTIRASRPDVSDAERQRAAQVGATITSRFQVRRAEVPDLTAQDQLVCDGRTFAIVGVKEVGGRFEGWEISAAAQADAAP